MVCLGVFCGHPDVFELDSKSTRTLLRFPIATFAPFSASSGRLVGAAAI